MDANSLLQCFAGTLEANQAIRQLAENQLRVLSQTPGFLGACLDIIASPEVAPGCQKAAAVYFKNRVVRYWNHPHEKIDDGEKPLIKERIIPVLVAVDHATKQQLVPVLRVLVSFEFPLQWPSLLHETGELLQKQHSPSSIYTGVLCFAEICRYYRWVSNKEREKDLDPMVVRVFPHLLALGGAILASEITEVSAEILKLILKTYKFVTYYDLPKVLQTKETLVAWGQFHCAVVNTAPPAYVLAASMLDQEKSQLQIAKCYKWAVANVERLFRRYASRDLSSKMKYDDFRTMFVAEFIPHLMAVYLALVEQWCAGDRWLSSPTLYHVLEFMSHGVTQKETWAIIRPFFENLVSHFIFPLLCPSQETLEMFENDPSDYINSKLDNYDDVAPDIAALGLLVTLVSKKKKTTLEPIVAFAYAQLSALQKEPESLDVAKKKEGVLRLVGGISHLLTAPSSPYYPQMEKFLAELVLPNLSSSFEFLQARTLDVCSKFAELPFESTATLSVLFNGILRPFGSDSANVSLPVTLESALAIQAFMGLPQFKEVLSTIILPTMSKLLELANEIDNDAVSIVMQECVENFSEQLQPFGVDLMKNLAEQFMKLAAEVNEAANVDVDDFDGDYVDLSDKIMAAIGLLNTMITVLLSFENSKEICIKLEETFSPVIDYVLSNNLDDFLSEIGELMENSIFLLRSVSPLMWRHFGSLYKSFSDGIALMYTEELSQCLKNFMVFGHDDLASHPDVVSQLLSIISIIIQGDQEALGYNDIVLACELAQTLVLSLQHNASPYLPELAKTIMPVLVANKEDTQHVRNNAMTVGLVNFLVASLVYDSTGALNILQQFLYLDAFFEAWFALVPLLKRVYDIKLSILGLISLANNPEAIQGVQNIGPVVGSKLSVLFKELPVAIKNFETQRMDFNEADYLSMQNINSQYDEEPELDDNFSDGSGEHENTDNTKEYLDFLQQENSRLGSSGISLEDDPVYEDPLATTPLDNINPFQIFKDFSNSLQNSNPAMYGLVFDNLTPNERQIFVDIFEVST